LFFDFSRDESHYLLAPVLQVFFYRIELGYYVTQIIGTRLTFPRGLDFLLERALPFPVIFVPEKMILRGHIMRFIKTQEQRTMGQ
jgi:hypothetical protein